MCCRTSYSFVAQARRTVPNSLALLWFSQYAPDTSTYIPIYVASTILSRPWIRGTMHAYDPESAWWNFCAAGNYASRFYIFAIKSVRELQDRLLDEAVAGVAAVEASAR